MTITQLLTDLALVAGILLMAVLAIAPLWLEHEARTAETLPEPTPIRPAHTHPTATPAQHAA